MKAKRPTKKQAALLEFIQEYTDAHDLSPSYREIMQALQLRSVSAVAEHISNCVKAGFLEKIPNQARSLRVVPIETHDETVNFFNQKIAELDRELALCEDNLSNIDLPNNKISFKDVEVASYEDTQAKIKQEKAHLIKQCDLIEGQLATLRSAADILEIDL